MRTPGLRSPQQLLDDVRKRVTATWAPVVCGDAAWRPTFHLGTSQLTGEALRACWSDVHLDTLEWGDWARDAGDGVRLLLRAVSYARRTRQDIAAAVEVASIDTAAALLGPPWPDRLGRARARRDLLAERFPDLEDRAAMVRAMDAFTDVEVEVACRAARWFADHPHSGLTPRQVPVEGMGTKWLRGHAPVVRRLAGLDDLGLVPGRPPRVHLTYLDPTHLRDHGRRHDVATAGDRDVLAYRPRVVIISENRDTAQLFPSVPGGIAVEGDGNGPGAVPDLGWLQEASTVWYWGDMDAKGLEILDAYRRRGVAARSLFMDMDAYRRWRRYGVDHDEHGVPLRAKAPSAVPGLTDAERELYLALCSPDWDGPRRIEQELIPLEVAAAVVREH